MNHKLREMRKLVRRSEGDSSGDMEEWEAEVEVEERGEWVGGQIAVDDSVCSARSPVS